MDWYYLSNSRVCQIKYICKYICKHQCHGIASLMFQQNVSWIGIAFPIPKCVR